MKNILLLSCLCGLLLTGCGTQQPILDERGAFLVEQYASLWKGTTTVMSNYFNIRSASKSDGIVIAEPQMTSDLFTKYRTRAKARLFQDSTGQYDVEVRVSNELEVSEPLGWGEQQPHYSWVTVAFDHAIEAKIVREIKVVAFGGQGTGWKSQFGRPFAVDEGTKIKPDPPKPLVMPTEPDNRIIVPDPTTSAAPAAPADPPAAANPVMFKKDGTHLAFLAQGQVLKDEPFTRQIAVADLAFARGQYQIAAAEFRKAVDMKPEEAIGHFALSDALFAGGNYSSAAAEIKAGLALRSDWPSVKMDRRSFYADPKEFDRHLRLLEEWAGLHPEIPSPFLVLGYTYYFSGQPEKSREAFATVVKLDLTDTTAKAFLAAQSQ